MKIINFSRLVVYLTLTVVLAVSASCSAGTVLDEAWQEYRLQNFSKARRIFQKLLKDASSEDDKIRARFGIASVVHYQLPGRNPGKALSLYEELLESVPAGHALRPALLYRIGECHYSKTDMDAALKSFERVRTEHPDSIEAREATLRIAYVHMAGGKKENFRKAADVLEKDLEARPDHRFVGCLHQACAYLLITLEDYEGARSHLIKWYEKGIANFNNEGNILYMVANISETKLGDLKTAVEYYEKLAKKSPSDYRNYMCEIKVKKLRERIDSGRTGGE